MATSTRVVFRQCSTFCQIFQSQVYPRRLSLNLNQIIYKRYTCFSLSQVYAPVCGRSSALFSQSFVPQASRKPIYQGSFLCQSLKSLKPRNAELQLQKNRTYVTLQSEPNRINLTRPSHKMCVRGFINRLKVDRRGKKGKKKTCKAVAKRFIRTGKGKLKYWKPGKNHNMLKKCRRRRRELRKPTYCNSRQLRKLNKMLNGW